MTNPTAFFIAGKKDILQEPGGEDLSKYKVVICGGNADPIMAKDKWPGITFLGYFSPWLVGPWTSGIQGLELASYIEEDFFHNSAGDRVLGWPPYQWALNFTTSVADKKTAHAERLFAIWPNGIFFDDLHVNWPDNLANNMLGPNASFIQKMGLNMSWKRYVKNLWTKIKDICPANSVIMANTGYDFDDPFIRKCDPHGISIEEWWPTRIQKFQEEVAFRYSRDLSVTFNCGDGSISRRGYQRRG